MEKKRSIKIHLSREMKKELAKNYPELVRSVIEDEPDEMYVDQFIDDWGLLERFVKKMEKNLKIGKERHGRQGRPRVLDSRNASDGLSDVWKNEE